MSAMRSSGEGMRWAINQRDARVYFAERCRQRDERDAFVGEMYTMLVGMFAPALNAGAYRLVSVSATVAYDRVCLCRRTEPGTACVL
jgi:hypothetical protein